ncbi:unnamed protein product [Malus baccata var. baccata]
MLSPFSCGIFHSEDVQDEPINVSSPCSTPRRSKRSSKDSKNPYSSRGLDKFSALLADLEEKRQKIYAQTPPQDISFVRFVFKDSKEDAPPIPIVIKLKDNKKEDHKEKTKTQLVKEKHATRNSGSLDKFTVEPSTPTKEVAAQQPPKNDKRVRSSLNLKGMNLGMWRRPSYYLPVVVVFILVLLAVFGRSFAILCMSIGWYALPKLKESNSETKRASKKKDHGRRLSDNNNNNNNNHGSLSSPKSNNTAADSTPRSQQHGHRKSW